MTRISRQRARRARIAAQGLGRAHPTIEAALEESGLVRTLGGVEAYVALFGRVAGLSAADVHAAVDRRAAQVVPAVRGCMYVVARRHAPLCLRVAERMSSARDQREHDRAGVRPGELDDLGRAIVETLRADPAGLTTDALRRALPAGAARSLGETGKKIGLSSTLPPALRRLEHRGQVVRAVDGGRLDSERYRWRAVADPAAYEGPDDWIDLLALIAGLYFRAAGIGSLTELAAWSGASRRDAAAAAEKLTLVLVEVEGEPAGQWMLEERRHLLDEAVNDLGPVDSDPVALLPFEDNLLALQGGPTAFVNAAHHDLSLAIEEPDRPTRLRDARHVWGRTLVAGGKVVGLWEYHPDQAGIAMARFAVVAPGVEAKLDREARALGAFLADQIGHGRSFSLDTDDELRRRAAVIATVSPHAVAPEGSPQAAPTEGSESAAPSKGKKPAAPPGKKPATPSGRKPAAPSKGKESAAKKTAAVKPAAKKPATPSKGKKPAAPSKGKKPAALSKAKKPPAPSKGKKPAAKKATSRQR